MSFEILFTEKAEKQFKKLQRDIQKRVQIKLLLIAENPRLIGSKKLSGSEDIFRVRIGDYRLIYEIHDDKLILLFLAMGHRKDIYRN